MAKRRKPIKRKGKMQRFSKRTVNSGPNKEGMEALGYALHARGIAIDEHEHNLMVHALRRRYPQDFNYNGKTTTDPKLANEAKIKELKAKDEIDLILEGGVKYLVYQFKTNLFRYKLGENYVYLESHKSGLCLISYIYRGTEQADLVLHYNRIRWIRKEQCNGNPSV